MSTEIFHTDSVECYNLNKNEWSFVAPMSEPHYGHAGTVHGGLMYVSGKCKFSKTLLISQHCLESKLKLTSSPERVKIYSSMVIKEVYFRLPKYIFLTYFSLYKLFK